jgi:hypothetical protein
MTMDRTRIIRDPAGVRRVAHVARGSRRAHAARWTASHDLRQRAADQPRPNIRTSFDGGVAQWDVADWRVDAFFVKPVLPKFASVSD